MKIYQFYFKIIVCTLVDNLIEPSIMNSGELT